MIDALIEVAPDIDAGHDRPQADLVDSSISTRWTSSTRDRPINEQTGIEIPERDYPKLSTINNAIGYLMQAQHSEPGADG